MAVQNKDLSAVEAKALLDPQGVPPKDLVKVALMSLLAGGAARLEERTKKGLIGTKTWKVVAPGQRAAADDPHASAVLTAIRPLGDDATMKTVVKRLRKAFGSDLSGFRTRVRDALAARGLIVARKERVLLLFSRTRFERTPAGERERSRLEGLLAEARSMSVSNRDPQAMAATVAGLGAAVLLVPELWPHLDELQRTLGDQFASAFSMEGFESFDGIIDSLSDFDSSFDSASGSDGGGSDGGGGDGGGGGD